MEVTFSARARTLDMLGRQQIAGIPTAISELFKNAHDAYAVRAEIDYYRSNRLFVLRDDGTGMTRDQFVERWLTIATETSVRRRESARQHQMPDLAPRPVLGEKGIGRLAIATVAPQVLVLTRARNRSCASDLTAAFLNWRFFESPQLNLRDIRIPVRTFRGGSLPDAGDVTEMVHSFERTNARLRELVGDSDWQRIEDDHSRFAVDPKGMATVLGEPSLAGDGHGTHFYLLPASDLLSDDIDGEADSDVASPLQKTLLGFTTPSLADTAMPVVRTAFREHKADGSCIDHIGEGEFFTRYDYENADHQVWGRFDDYGQFEGSVSVYGEVLEGHVINWQGGRGRPTACGPFNVRFAAVEGLARQSTIPSVDHTRIIRKAGRIGGLYIYRKI